MGNSYPLPRRRFSAVNAGPISSGVIGNPSRESFARIPRSPQYGQPVDLCGKIAEMTGLDRPRAAQMLTDAGTRARGSLKFGYNPISVDSLGSRAIDFAGLIRLSPSLELEVAPKFLGLDGANDVWREDFYFLATLSRYGHLLANERLSASGGAPRDLSTLVARSICGMYEARKRRPLRSYRRVKESDFHLDGEPDPTDLIFPGPDGFEQEAIRFDRRNVWNAAIRAAAAALIPEVGDPSSAASLMRVVEDLAPQSSATARTRKPIPSRHRAWTPLHSLSLDVLAGLGMSYKQGQAHAPGYLVSTWQIWEDLLTIATRLGFGQHAVAAQQEVTLGSRQKARVGASATALTVIPDFVIEAADLRPRFVLDAKYKGRAEKGSTRIEEADVYEAFAFAKATGCTRVVLAYPALPASGLRPQPGYCSVFETVSIEDIRIVGVQVEVRSISKRGALKTFAAQFASGVQTFAA